MKYFFFFFILILIFHLKAFTEVKTETKSELQLQTKTESNTGLKTQAKSETKAELKSEMKSELKSETKAEATLKAKTKTETKTEIKSQSTSGTQTQTKTEATVTSQAKTESTTNSELSTSKAELNSLLFAEFSKTNENCVVTCMSCQNALYYLKTQNHVECTYNMCPGLCSILSGRWHSSTNQILNYFKSDHINICETCFRSGFCHINDCQLQKGITQNAIRTAIQNFNFHALNPDRAIFNLINKKSQDYFIDMDFIFRNLDKMISFLNEYENTYLQSKKLKKIYKIFLRYLSNKSKLALSDINLNLDIEIDDEYRLIDNWKDIPQNLQVYKNYYVTLKSKNVHLDANKIYLSTDIKSEEVRIKSIQDFDMKIRYCLEKASNMTEIYKSKTERNLEILHKLVKFLDVVAAENLLNEEKLEYLSGKIVLDEEGFKKFLSQPKKSKAEKVLTNLNKMNQSITSISVNGKTIQIPPEVPVFQKIPDVKILQEQIDVTVVKPDEEKKPNQKKFMEKNLVETSLSTSDDDYDSGMRTTPTTRNIKKNINSSTNKSDKVNLNVLRNIKDMSVRNDGTVVINKLSTDQIKVLTGDEKVKGKKEDNSKERNENIQSITPIIPAPIQKQIADSMFPHQILIPSQQPNKIISITYPLNNESVRESSKEVTDIPPLPANISEKNVDDNKKDISNENSNVINVSKESNNKNNKNPMLNTVNTNESEKEGTQNTSQDKIKEDADKNFSNEIHHDTKREASNYDSKEENKNKDRINQEETSENDKDSGDSNNFNTNTDSETKSESSDNSFENFNDLFFLEKSKEEIKNYLQIKSDSIKVPEFSLDDGIDSYFKYDESNDKISKMKKYTDILEKNKIKKMSIDEIKESSKILINSIKQKYDDIETEKELKSKLKKQSRGRKFLRSSSKEKAESLSKERLENDDAHNLETTLKSNSNTIIQSLTNNLKSLDEQFFELKHNIITNLIK